MTTIYFLRHGKTKVQSDVPVSQWVLADSGIAEAERVAAYPDFAHFDVVIASGEEKARQTAEPIAKRLGLEILREPMLSELDRDKGGFMSAEVYEHTTHECLAKRDESFSSWETSDHALERFSKRIAEIEKEHAGKRILIVGHGMTMNLYFASILGELDKIHERFGSNTFCDWGIVEEGKVTRDLAK